MVARPVFDEELHTLNSNFIAMGELVKEAIDGSMEALQSKSATKAYLVARNDSLINEKEREIEALALRMLLREQPVATDLRNITAALKMVTDLERIGDQAAEICEIVTTLPEEADLSKFAALNAMAQKACNQVNSVIDAYICRDLDKAHAVIEGDTAINEWFYETKNVIVQHIIEHASDESYALDILMIAKYLERIGDHVTNIAEWVEYAVTGTYKGTALYED